MAATTQPAVSFKETVQVASLPHEEFREALMARKGPWGPAPLCDELYDGERRRFWERELSLDELKEIQRFRQKARYAAMFVGLNGVLGVKVVHMPKPPGIVLELVNLSVQEQQAAAAAAAAAAGMSTPDLAASYSISSPDSERASPKHAHAAAAAAAHATTTTTTTTAPTSATTTTAKAPKGVNPATYEAVYNSHVTEFFEYSNPLRGPGFMGGGGGGGGDSSPDSSPSSNGSPPNLLDAVTPLSPESIGAAAAQQQQQQQQPPPPPHHHQQATDASLAPLVPPSPSAAQRSSVPPTGKDGKRLSWSQQAAIKSVGKHLRVDLSSGRSPKIGSIGSSIHRRRLSSATSEKLRVKKRKQIHTLLQPWYIHVYFLFPCLLLFLAHVVPWLLNDVRRAYNTNTVIKWAVEVPWFLERVLHVPDFAKTTVFIGLFAVEVSTLIYLFLLLTSQLSIFLIVRPLLLDLMSSGEFKGTGTHSAGPLSPPPPS